MSQEFTSSCPCPGPYTERQKLIICKARQLMPENFSANVTDDKILAFAEVVVSDLNLFPPLTGFTTEDIPDRLLPVLYFGISVFAEMFFQMRATLEDFDYNDNGLSVRVDQVGKIGAALTNMLEVYKNMIINFKKTEILNVGGKGMGTPRYQSQIGQMLKIALGCLLPHVRVFTSRGYKKISEIEVGDLVLSADGNFHRVYDTLTRTVDEQIYEVRVGRKKIALTGNHEIFVASKGWIATSDLKIGDKVFVGAKLRPTKVSNILNRNYTGLVYDLSVEGVHSYNAEGIIVHNSAFTWNSP